jgi:hypothetical protein
MAGSKWHYYAEIYYNGRKEDGIYAHGSGVVTTDSDPDDAGWYTELRQEILSQLGARSSSVRSLHVMSLTRL